MKTNVKFQALETALNSELFERRQEVRTAILALIAKRHHFQVGPPGTAKSLLVNRIVSRIGGMPEGGYFHILLTRFTTPDELYGPPSLPDLELGVLRRNTWKKLPQAFIVFEDEIFKGSSSILNTNLTAMNERLYHNGPLDDPKIPLISMFAASNETQEGEELNALWDRLHFRHEIRPIQETTNFIKMIQNPMVANPEPIVTLQEIMDASIAASEVSIPEDIFDGIKSLRHELAQKGITATERRWMESMSIIRAEAWFNGREKVDMEDLRPLMHVLWSELDQQKTVRKTVLDLANPIDRDAADILDAVIDLETDFQKKIREKVEANVMSKFAYEIFGKIAKSRKQYNALEKVARLNGRSSTVLPDLKDKLDSLSYQLLQEGFQITLPDSDD